VTTISHLGGLLVFGTVPLLSEELGPL